MISYSLFGTGEVKLLFCMGLGGIKEFWKFQIEYFGKHQDYQVCVFDHRGVGQSSPYPTFGRVETAMVEDVYIIFQELQDKHGWKQIDAMIGISMGGMVAQKFAVKYNTIVKSLVLINTCYGWYNLFATLWNIIVITYARIVHNVDLFLKLIFGPEFIKYRIGEQPHIKQAIYEDLVEKRNYPSMHMFAIATFSMSDHDFMQINKLHKCIIVSKCDQIIAPKYSYELYNKFKNNERNNQEETEERYTVLHQLPLAGHASIIEYPHEINNCIHNFLMKIANEVAY